MPWPTDNLSTEHFDSAADDPSAARAELAKLIEKVKSIIGSRSVANGICELDDNILIPLARVPTTLRRTADSKKWLAYGHFAGDAPTTFVAQDNMAGVTRDSTNSNGGYTLTLSGVSWADTDAARADIKPEVTITKSNQLSSEAVLVGPVTPLGTNQVHVITWNASLVATDAESVKVDVYTRA